VSQSPVLEVQQLSKQYPSQVAPAVNGVSFHIQPGEILALLGPNGAGKTTTVKMIAGLVIPSGGHVRVLGHDVERQRRQAVRHIGAVLEGTRNLYWRLSAKENLLYFGSLRLVPRTHLRRRIPELLRLLHLDGHEGEEVRHFSRGMQQKVAIAAALLHDPDLVLLDEPTLGLDVQAAQTVEKTIRRLAKEEGKAILLTTHVMPLAERLAHRILVIHQGRSVAYDTTRALLARYRMGQETTEIQITGPLTATLLERLKNHYPEVRIRHRTGQVNLTWPSAPQGHVLQLLQELDDWGIEILYVGRRQPTLEEVFLALTEEPNL